MATFEVDGIQLTRVPYFDVALGSEVIGFSGAQVAAVPWGVPDWATPEAQVLVGQAVWVIQSDTRTVVVDPCGAADPFLRSGPEATAHQDSVAAALSSAGLPVERVDTVVLSHLDGIGMAAAVDTKGAWVPFFPNAKVVLSQGELHHVAAHPEVGGASALRCLTDQGVVKGVDPPWEAAPGVALELSGGHSPGHCVLRVGEGAVFVGHLAISPLQASAGIMRGQHHDGDTAHTALEHELAWASHRKALVIGPLWPEPGAGRVTGPPWVVSAA
jgi:glyoxylase-like metal-dependent hydrolase (beta-lactamase superfamily II)